MSDELSVKLPDTVVRALTVLARAGYVGTNPAGIASYLVMRGIDDLIRAGVVKHTDLLGKRLSALVESAAAQEPAPQQSEKPAQNMRDPIPETRPTEEEGSADRVAGPPDVTAPAGECASDRVAGTAEVRTESSQKTAENPPTEAAKSAPSAPPAPAHVTPPAVAPARETPVATAGAAPAISKATAAAMPMRTPERKVLMLDLYQTAIQLDRLAERMNALPGRPMARHNVSEWGKDLRLTRRGMAIPVKYLPRPTAGAVVGNDGRPIRDAKQPANPHLAADEPDDGDEEPDPPKPSRVNKAFPSFLLKWGRDRGLAITLPLDDNQMAQINAKAFHLGLPPFELAGRE